MHNFVTAATNLMVFLIGALRDGDSINVTSCACSSIPVFKRPGIILACALVMSYTLKEKGGMWHETSIIVAATSACVENYMKKFITIFCMISHPLCV